MKKKAAIITLHYVDNYGSVLQAYASQVFFDDLGFDTSIINYVRPNYRFKGLIRDAESKYKNRHDIFSLYLFRKLLLIRWAYKYLSHEKNFRAFRKRLRLTDLYGSFEELKDKCPVADLFITGSDQVWNNQYNGGFLPEYYLAFCDERKDKIAFSSSFGQDSFDDHELIELKKYVHNYKCITVRENNGLEILEKVNYKNAKLILDPTLFISANRWKTLCSLRENTQKYILLYQLNYNDNMESFVKQLSADTGLKVVIVSDAYKKTWTNSRLKNNLLVEEFLNCIYNASYVVTDSFHGTAFSFNFNVPVFCFLPPKYGNRITSFLKLIRAEDRLVKDNTISWKLYQDINFDRVNSILDDERKKCICFFEKNLDLS